MSKFFAYLNRMKYIKRWSLMNFLKEENIMEHTQQVSVIAHALVVIANKVYNKNLDEKSVVLMAQYHEVSEVITGDLPTPIKYFNPEIKNAYKDLEEKASIKLLDMLPEEFKEEYKNYILPNTDSYEYKLVKTADKISAYIKCVEELKSGNKEFKKAKDSIEKEIKKMCIEEAEYYMQKFVPAYSLTLDEL